MGTPKCAAEMLEGLTSVRDKVLDRSGLVEGETLLDVGCGEGLIGFGALERGAGHVVFSDISDDLLDFCREAAEALGVAERCSFVKAACGGARRRRATRASTSSRTRSVLIYVDREGSGPSPSSSASSSAGGRISLLRADQPLRHRGAQQRASGAIPPTGSPT